MRTFVVSIGNTSIAGGVFDAGKRVGQFRVPTRDAATSREFAGQIFARVRGTIDRAALCSVVPKLTAAIARAIQTRWKVTPTRLTAERASIHGLTIGYRKPAELGTDRIAAAFGAREILGARDAIVIDCGTATTLTALRRDGVLLGGAIIPGVALWPEMLAARTAQLPTVPLRHPRSAVGRSTREGLQSGIFHGHAGAIRELGAQMRREAFGRREVVIIGTGGNAKWFSEAGIFSRCEPELVLIGLDRFAREGPAE